MSCPKVTYYEIIVCRNRTWRWEDDPLKINVGSNILILILVGPWAHIKVFRTSFYVPASEERKMYVRLGHDVVVTSLTSRRIRTSGNLSYGPKIGRPLNVRKCLAFIFLSELSEPFVKHKFHERRHELFDNITIQDYNDVTLKLLWVHTKGSVQPCVQSDIDVLIKNGHWMFFFYIY